jgi:hypothetical protein
MMSSHIRRILKLGLLIGDMMVSATGGFALMRGFRLLATEEKDRTRRVPFAP